MVGVCCCNRFYWLLDTTQRSRGRDQRIRRNSLTVDRDVLLFITVAPDYRSSCVQWSLASKLILLDANVEDICCKSVEASTTHVKRKMQKTTIVRTILNTLTVHILVMKRCAGSLRVIAHVYYAWSERFNWCMDVLNQCCFLELPLR